MSCKPESYVVMHFCITYVDVQALSHMAGLAADL